VTAAELITELKSRGVILTPHADGEHLRVRPAEALDPCLLAELKTQRDAVLAELRQRRGESPVQDDDGSLVDSAEQIGAVLLRSRRFGDVWLARDDRVADELVAELAATGQATPVLTYAEAPLLRGKSDRMLRALLTAKSALPGSRLLQ
jgi:hypothetical protein